MDWIWYHALPLIVFGVPLIGFLWELLVGLLCRKNCWLLFRQPLNSRRKKSGRWMSLRLRSVRTQTVRLSVRP